MAGYYTPVTGYSADLQSLIKRCLTQAPDRRPNAGAAQIRPPCAKSSCNVAPALSLLAMLSPCVTCFVYNNYPEIDGICLRQAFLAFTVVLHTQLPITVGHWYFCMLSKCCWNVADRLLNMPFVRSKAAQLGIALLPSTLGASPPAAAHIAPAAPPRYSAGMHLHCITEALPRIVPK